MPANRKWPFCDESFWLKHAQKATRRPANELRPKSSTRYRGDSYPQFMWSKRGALSYNTWNLTARCENNGYAGRSLRLFFEMQRREGDILIKESGRYREVREYAYSAHFKAHLGRQFYSRFPIVTTVWNGFCRN